MEGFNKVIINKNRGWRGLAEVEVKSDTGDTKQKMVFSFSQPVWDDLIRNNIIVTQDKEYYYVLYLTACAGLPSPTQQRSVLIKNAVASIEKVNKIEKKAWTSAKADDWFSIMHFNKNRNNHTTSDWNCIGLRVIPSI